MSTDFQHGWAETRDLKPADRLLRVCGFAILSRPKGKPAVWRRHGKAYSDQEAMALVEAAIRRKPA